jgi:hypothetical protein
LELVDVEVAEALAQGEGCLSSFVGELARLADGVELVAWS